MANWKKLLVSGSIAEFSHISSSGNIVPTDNKNGDLGSAEQAWKDLYLGDSGVIQFGDDQDVTLTHIADTGLLLTDNSGVGTTQLQFGDSGTYISQLEDGTLGIVADTELDIAAPLIDINDNTISGSSISTGSFGSLHVAGNAVIGGNLTFGDSTSDSVSFIADVSSSLIPDVTGAGGDNTTFDLGSDTQRWHHFYQSGSSYISSSLFDVDSTGDVTFDINSDTANAFRVTTNAASSEQITFTNTLGSTDGIDGDGAILLDAQAGGIGLAWNDTADLWAEGGRFVVTANENEAGAITLDASNSHGSTTLVITSKGTGAQAIDIDSTGGIDIDATDVIDIKGGQLWFSSADNSKNAIQLTTNIGSGETISIGNKAGTGAWTVGSPTISNAAINISASVGGIAIASKLGLLISSSAGDVDVYSEDGSVNLTSKEGDGSAIKISATETGGGVDIDAGTGGIDILSTAGVVNIVNTGDNAFTLNSNAGNLKLDSGKVGEGAIEIIATGASAATIQISSSGTTAQAIDIDSAGGLDIDVIGILDINAGDDSVIKTTTSGKDLAVGVSGGGTQTLTLSSAGTGTNAIDINATAGGLDIDVNGVLDIQAGDDSSIAVAGSNKNLSIAVTGGSTQTLTLASAGTGTNAIDINATAGGIDIDATGGAISIDTTNTGTGITIGTTTATSPVTIGFNHENTTTTIQSNLIVNQNTTIGGNLVVNGTTTTIASTTLAVADAFIFAASGSAGDFATNVDGGLVIQSGSAEDSGSAIYHDKSDGRWAVAKQVGSTDTTISATQQNGFVVTVKNLSLGGVAPHSLPDGTAATNVDGAALSASYGVGEIIIDTDSPGDIWILGN